MPEPRTAVMILVEASWADQTGLRQAVPACMENRSTGGACIRIKTPVGVGSKLTLQSRWELISGTARYCRGAGRDYLVGIQRDSAKNMPDGPIPARAPIREKVKPAAIPPVKVSPTEVPESRAAETPTSGKEAVHLESLGAPSALDYPIDIKISPRSAQSREAIDPEFINRETRRPSRTKQTTQERKPMQRKWSELMHLHNPKDEATRSEEGHTNGKAAEEVRESPAEDSSASFRIDLLPVEAIYRTAGIASLQRGYSISKVVEMVHSEHARGLSKEAKRSAVRIALDAAGVPVDEVLRDAKARREALDSYEAEVRKEVEAEWAQKAEENVQIQAELERVKAHYGARIARNQEGVVREKAVFNHWLTMKQQEAQSISEAAELCVKPAVSEPVGGPLPVVSMAAAGAKLV